MPNRRNKERVDLYLDASQKARWQTAADANHMNLSQWIRRSCDDTVERLYPTHHLLVPKQSKERCVRWMYHVVGVYCPGCDRVIPG